MKKRWQIKPDTENKFEAVLAATAGAITAMTIITTTTITMMTMTAMITTTTLLETRERGLGEGD